ncbi:hypothetical protein L484_000793 [Morus notabilis]|uniref:Uncharacterized protein n=1 Tax=Morus notabilis TaxID=981085 RepID=W9QIS8_9ROSA|nr:hypothetical protein L484_000793 [Morus notabilis]
MYRLYNTESWHPNTIDLQHTAVLVAHPILEALLPPPTLLSVVYLLVTALFSLSPLLHCQFLSSTNDLYP